MTAHHPIMNHTPLTLQALAALENHPSDEEVIAYLLVEQGRNEPEGAEYWHVIIAITADPHHLGRFDSWVLEASHPALTYADDGDWMSMDLGQGLLDMEKVTRMVRAEVRAWEAEDSLSRRSDLEESARMAGMVFGTQGYNDVYGY